MVFHTTGTKWTEGVQKQIGENIWIKKRGCNRSLEKII